MSKRITHRRVARFRASGAVVPPKKTRQVCAHRAGPQKKTDVREIGCKGGGNWRGGNVERKEQGGEGRARIDHLPRVMDGAISGSGQRRRGESDFCFSTS